jgi:predicted restriction endonuclease
VTQPDPQESRAVLIGTGQYEHMEDLPAATRNLHALRQELMRHELWGLSPQHCETVEDPSSTETMIGPVRRACDEAREVLLVYFAGHGVLGPNGDLHLGLPSTRDERTHSYYTAVPYETLRTTVRTNRARIRVVILDCCFSGLAVNTMGSASTSVFTDIEGTYTITSAPPTQPSIAPKDAEFTAFSGELIDILRNGIQGADEFLTLDVIYDHIQRELAAKSFPNPWRQDRNDAGRIPLLKNLAISAAKSPPGYGEIPGFEENTRFSSRQELHDTKVHRPLRAGICGRQQDGGAESIVLSGGYPDDKDYGKVIVYTGHGGRDDNGKQVRDQDPSDTGNAALLASITTRYPVRVIRGSTGDPHHSPNEGYSYDGLYTVEEYWTTVGVEGFRVLQFRLEKLNSAAPPTVPTDAIVDQPGIALHRWEPIALGVYGDRRVADKVKRAHNHECQICGVVLQTPAGQRFTQTFYLKGLARPHQGPDDATNILCVCPTHRIQLELGSITIDDDFKVIDEISGTPCGQLNTASKHKISLEYVRYHRELYRNRSRRPGGGI